jgi:hypothetical protein
LNCEFFVRFAGTRTGKNQTTEPGRAIANDGKELAFHAMKIAYYAKIAEHHINRAQDSPKAIPAALLRYNIQTLVFSGLFKPFTSKNIGKNIWLLCAQVKKIVYSPGSASE